MLMCSALVDMLHPRQQQSTLRPPRPAVPVQATVGLSFHLGSLKGAGPSYGHDQDLHAGSSTRHVDESQLECSKPVNAAGSASVLLSMNGQRTTSGVSYAYQATASAHPSLWSGSARWIAMRLSKPA